jgi:apolipoprotein N-acyltransferase
MRVLELLKSYVDKGIEPPPSVAELLSEQVMDPTRAWKSSARGARLERFVGFLFTGCVIGGVAWWLVESAGPAWAVYPAVSAAVFFSVGAIGFLLTAVVIYLPEFGRLIRRLSI